MLSRMKLLAKWLLSATALLALTYLHQGVAITGFETAMLAVFVIAMLNMVLRPILIILTLPVTVVTMGLFLFVINALMFWSAAGVMDGFKVDGFGAALLGSLIYSVMNTLIDAALEHLFRRR